MITKCKLIHPSKLPEVEQLLYYLQNRKEKPVARGQEEQDTLRYSPRPHEDTVPRSSPCHQVLLLPPPLLLLMPWLTLTLCSAILWHFSLKLSLSLARFMVRRSWEDFTDSVSATVSAKAATTEAFWPIPRHRGRNSKQSPPRILNKTRLSSKAAFYPGVGQDSQLFQLSNRPSHAQYDPLGSAENGFLPNHFII